MHIHYCILFMSSLNVEHFTMSNNKRSAAAAAAAAGTPSQQWMLDSSNALRSIATSKCLDVPGRKYQQGAQMQVRMGSCCASCFFKRG
jgi:hypothetical protein